MILRGILIAVLSLVAATVAPLFSWAHGTRGVCEPAEGIRVKAAYDDGEPMSYAAVEVRREAEKLAFQKGRADSNGVFMFAPDRPGKWRIAVSDEMGHRLEMEWDAGSHAQQANAATTSAGRQTAGARFSRREGIAAGLAVIFGLCGFAYGWKANRRLARQSAEKDA